MPVRRSMHVSAAGGESSSSGRSNGNGNGSSLGDLAGQNGSSSRSNGGGAAPQNGNGEQKRKIKWAQTSFKVGMPGKPVHTSYLWAARRRCT